jgi:hypothetical protein
MKKPVLLAGLALATSLSGCVVAVVGMMAAAAVGSTNSDPITFQDGVATRIYTISFDRCCGSVDTALKGISATLDPVGIHEADRAAWSGKLADGRPFTIKALSQNLLTQVDVKVGTEDMEADRTSARDIHAKIDDDVEVVRRHYPEGFPTVWNATEKTELSEQQKVNPNNQIGRIAGKLKDGTPVVITLQLVAESRTRVTVEVGSKPTPEAQQQALELAHQISKALGVEAEEEKK